MHQEGLSYGEIGRREGFHPKERSLLPELCIVMASRTVIFTFFVEASGTLEHYEENTENL
jgi:hypothetical protein